MAEILTLTRAPQQRLDAALRLLDQAQAEQRRAIGTLRESLYDLRDTAGRLQASVHGWHREVSALSGAVATARARVAALEATAAGM